MRAHRRRALLNEYMHVGYILLLCWIDDIVYLAMKLVKSRLQHMENSSVNASHYIYEWINAHDPLCKVKS